MARRAKAYESETAQKLRTPAYADSYMKAAIYNHNTPFKEALAVMINKFGHAELAELIDMEPNNVTRMVKRLLANEDLKTETLERLLGGFGLTLKMDTEIASTKSRRAL